MPNLHFEPGGLEGDDSLAFDIVVHRDPLDRTTVVQVSGELDIVTVGRLEATLWEAVARPGERLLVDLSDCAYLDSTGAASLAWARRALDRDSNGGPPMVLVAVEPEVLRALEVGGVERHVPTVEDRHVALDLLLQAA